MKKVLGIGNALVDVLMHMDSDNLLDILALPKGSMQLIDKVQMQTISSLTANIQQTRVAGGSASNTITGLSQLNVSTGFIGKVGNDEFGSFYRSDLSARGVKEHLLCSSQPSGRCNVFISPDAERTMATYLGAAIDLAPEDLLSNVFNAYDILHIEGYLVQNRDLLIRACEIAKSQGLEVSLDLASFNIVEENLDFLRLFVEKYVDIVFANEEEAYAFSALNDEHAANFIAQLCNIAVVKLGKRGSIIQSGNEVVFVETEAIDVADTTGAGDLYASGFLYGYVHHFNLPLCGKIGSICASKVIQVVGAKIPLPIWKDIEKEILDLNS